MIFSIFANFVKIESKLKHNNQPRNVINAHSALRAIQNGGCRNFKEAEKLFFEN